METSGEIRMLEKEQSKVAPLEEGIGEVTELLGQWSGLFFKPGAAVSSLEKGSYDLRPGLIRDVYTIHFDNSDEVIIDTAVADGKRTFNHLFLERGTEDTITDFAPRPEDPTRLIGRPSSEIEIKQWVTDMGSPDRTQLFRK
jgi:hypothetical protein